jgi:hypothetical protein
MIMALVRIGNTVNVQVSRQWIRFLKRLVVSKVYQQQGFFLGRDFLVIPIALRKLFTDCCFLW